MFRRQGIFHHPAVDRGVNKTDLVAAPHRRHQAHVGYLVSPLFLRKKQQVTGTDLGGLHCLPEPGLLPGSAGKDEAGSFEGSHQQAGAVHSLAGRAAVPVRRTQVGTGRLDDRFGLLVSRFGAALPGTGVTTRARRRTAGLGTAAGSEPRQQQGRAQEAQEGSPDGQGEIG